MASSGHTGSSAASARTRVAITAHSGSMTPAWQAAAVPFMALLGGVLPLVYLPQLGDYLFYLRPADLIPTYGTAWLLLAALALPVWLLLALVLRVLASPTQPAVRAAHDGLAVGLGGLATAIVAAALVYCALIWLQTFSVLRDLGLRGGLLWGTLLIGGAIGVTPPGRQWIRRLGPLVNACATLGLLAALSLPLYGWRTHAPPGSTMAAAAPATVPAAAAASKHPNILLLSFDAMSAEHMSVYGAQRPTTPMLAQFARGATTFDQAYANGNFTTPGIASMLTSTRPWTHRALQLQSWPTALTRWDSLPAVLHRAGYRTGYVSTNSAAGATRNGLGAYFDFSARDRTRDLDLCADSLSALLRYVCPVAAMPLFASLITVADRIHGRDAFLYDPRLAIDPALDWLQYVDKRQPVFLWVHLFPPHSPYVTPSPWLGHFSNSTKARDIADTEPHWAWSMSELSSADVRVLGARYDESVLYVDHYGGLFLQRALQILGPQTAVIVTADHGESFRHGYGAHTGPGLYNELIRIPLIIKLPGQAQPLRSEAVVEQIDIAPTLAQLAGAPAPASWEGRSLLGAWSNADPLPAKPAFSMNFEQSHRFGALTTGSVAVIDGQWKLVHYLGHLHYPRMPALHDTLYDLASDPLEITDLSGTHPGEVAQLRTLIDAQLAKHAGPLPGAAR